MQDLLKPDFGVLFLTVCNFLLLVYLLKKFAWGPIIGALEKREQQISQDKQTAAEARQSAQALRQELETRLAQISQEASQKMAQAVEMGQAQKEQLLAQAKEQAERLLEQAKAQIAAEKNQALAQVRSEIASLSVLAATRVIQREVNPATAQEIVTQVIEEVKGN